MVYHVGTSTQNPLSWNQFVADGQLFGCHKWLSHLRVLPYTSCRFLRNAPLVNLLHAVLVDVPLLVVRGMYAHVFGLLAAL